MKSKKPIVIFNCSSEPSVWGVRADEPRESLERGWNEVARPRVVQR
jgi:hypothetical protein